MRLRRGSRRTWFPAALAALVVGAVAGWLLASSHTAGQISVAWSNDSPACTGAAVASMPTEPSRRVIHARRGMHCTVTIVVTNNSRFSVHLDALLAPYVGPRPDTVVQAEPQPGADAGPSDEGEAHYPLDVDLVGGAVYTVEIGLGFQEHGCGAATTGLKQWPSLSFHALGLPHSQEAADTLWFVQGGPSTECPDRDQWDSNR